jgi:hypothetical protein
METGEQEGGTGTAKWGGLAPVGRERWQGKGVGGGIWCKICVRMYINEKLISVETVPEIGGGGTQGSGKNSSMI